MSTSRKIKNLMLGAVALGVACGGFVAIPASAAPTYSAPASCASGAACVWADPYYATAGGSWQMLYWYNSVPNMHAYKYGGTSITVGNTVSSFYNNGNYSEACVFNNAGSKSGSPWFCLPIEAGDNRASDYGYDNTASSGWFM